MRLSLLTGVLIMISLNAAAEDFLYFNAKHVFSLEWVSNPQISPDGNKVVYVRTSMDRKADRARGALWEYDLKNGTHRPFVADSGSVGSPRWSPSGDRVLYTSGGELRVRYVEGDDDFPLTQLDRNASPGAWSPDGTRIAFTSLITEEAPTFAEPIKAPKGASWAPGFKVIDELRFRFDGAGYLEKGTRQLFVVSSEGGAARQITDDEADYQSPVWLDEAHVLASGNDSPTRLLDRESEIYRVNVNTGARTTLTSRKGPDDDPQVSPDGSLVAYTGFDDEIVAYKQNDLYVMSSDGKDPRNLTAGFDRAILDAQWHPSGRSLLALVNSDGDMKIMSVALDGQVRALVDSVGGASIGRPYSGGSFSVASTARGQALIAYNKASANRPAELAVYKGKEAVLTNLNRDTLPYIDLARVEPIEVNSSFDGRAIQAWIALPPGFEQDGSYPMIMDIHGGPFAMYGPFFSAEMQRYAAEGYVVVWANPRGSTGYGEAFAQLIDRAYPGNDYDDLMSVVDQLIADKYVNVNRLFVTGGSGGGILTAWIVGKTDRFRAAASIKPVINWITMALAADIAPTVAKYWMQAMPWEDINHYWQRSPISLIGNVTTPTMVMVGEEDWRTPTWEAEQFYTALKLKGVETVLVRVPGSSHSIASRPSRLIGKTDNILGWFRKFDPSQAEQD